MYELGKKNSQLWYTQEEYDLVRKASKLVRRPMSTFAILAVLREAKRIIADDECHLDQ